MTTSLPKVSVVIPLLNANPGFFSDTLDSLTRQTMNDFEVVIVEDPGATSIADDVEKRADHRLRLIRSAKRIGFADQLNRGLSAAKGEFIARIDGDDLAEPTRLEKQVQVLTQDPSLAVVGSFLSLIDAHGKRFGTRTYPITAIEVAKGARLQNPLAHPSVMFRKAIVCLEGGYDLADGMTADYGLWARLLCRGYSLVNIPEPLTAYRIHPGASKFWDVRPTLQATIAIKRRFFRCDRSGWTIEAQIRLSLETILLRLPPAWVCQMFLWTLGRG